MKKITFLIFLFLFQSIQSKAQISTFPYVNTGDDITGWNVVQSQVLWYIGTMGINPAGATNNAGLVCNSYGQPSGVEGLVVSPAFNFTALAKPVLHFYVAYRNYSTQNDSLQVLISTDGGSSFVDTPVPYRKANNSVPSLATLPSSVTEFNPSNTSQWRHETIDLTAYAGVNNVFIAFRGVSDFGNNLWIDNFIVTNDDGYCASNITASGNYSCNPTLTTTFNTIGLAPSGNENILDNPTGGVLSVTEHLNQNPVPTVAAQNIAVNTTATTHDGSIFTPNIVAPEAWFTVSYTGNDLNGYANYDLTVDVTTYISILDITKLYIMKRSDLTGSWVCLNTIVSSGNLKVLGLTTFSDFGIGGDTNSNPLPVELESFISQINGRDVILKWTTSSELNNAGFDIERSSDEISWTKIGNVAGNGTTDISKDYIFTDNNLVSGKYNYRLKQIDFNGNYRNYILSNEVVIGVPERFELSQNYPNPFNPVTKINFNIPTDSKVSLKVFDMTGKEIAVLINEFKPAGYYSVNFSAASADGVMTSGVYFYTLTSGNFISTKKMLLIK